MALLIVLGAGGHGRVLAETAIATGDWQGVFHLDDDMEFGKFGVTVCGPISALDSFNRKQHVVALGIGNNVARLTLLSRCRSLGFKMPPIVHPRATVSHSARLDIGSVVLAGAVVSTEVVISAGVIVNHGAVVDHDTYLEEGVHISPGACLAGGVWVGSASWIGVGASVRDGVRIGARVLVGAGAAVVSDIPDDCVVVGVPARERGMHD